MQEVQSLTTSGDGGEAPAAGRAVKAAGVCAHCGYDLRGLPTPRCPECGREFDPYSVVDSKIPWSHRRTLGTAQAFWRTVWLVSFNPSRFAAEYLDGYRLTRDGERFRHAVVWYAAAGVAVFPAGVLLLSPRPAGAVAVVVVVSAFMVAGLAYFHLATALFGMFASRSILWDPKDPTSRALMAADYASAALAWSPLFAAASVLVLAVLGPRWAEVAILTAVLVQFLWWWLGVMTLYSATARPPTLRLAVAALLFPVRALALVLFTFVFVVLPLVGCGSFLLMLAYD